MTVVLNLGGTINTSYINEKPVQVGLQGIIDSNISVIDIMPVSSNNLNWEHLWLLRKYILEKRKAKETQFVVTTGTDSLEEVAYFLSLILPEDVSLVVVGALRMRSDPESDGERWLASAFNWLREKTNQGVAVCCGGPVIAGSAVEKVYLNGWTFRALSNTKDGLKKWSLKEEYNLRRRAPNIPILPVGIGIGPWLATILEIKNFDGVVIEAYAAGDVPSSICEPLRRLVSGNIPVVLASRSNPGLVEPLFPGELGCSHDLLSIGVLGAGNLDAGRARIRLMVALAARPHISANTIFGV